jgi:hypothetical protein
MLSIARGAAIQAQKGCAESSVNLSRDTGGFCSGNECPPESPASQVSNPLFETPQVLTES